CDSTTLDRMRPGPLPGRSTTAAAVSSHVVSMPSTTIADSIHSFASPGLEGALLTGIERCRCGGLGLLPPPLWGRGVVVGARDASANCHPHPQPLPTRGIVA